MRLEWGVGAKRGGPAKSEPAEGAGRNENSMAVRWNISFAGLNLFDAWLETTDALSERIRILKETAELYKASFPEESFPLLNHRADTLRCRFKALLYAPLFGIGKLTEYDVKVHAL